MKGVHGNGGCSGQVGRLTEEEAEEIARFAARDGQCYAPATEDLWFKFAVGSDGATVSLAFVRTALALSFRDFNTASLVARKVERKEQVAQLLPSRPNTDRRVATDFACAVRLEKTSPEVGCGGGSPASAVLRDSIGRGIIVSSEMQVASSDMIGRADDYVAFLKQRDHGIGTKDGRLLKLDSAGEISRSVAEVVWEVDKDNNAKIQQDVHCLAYSIAGPSIECARGDAITIIPLVQTPGNLLGVERDAGFQQKVSQLMGQMEARVDAYFAERAIVGETKRLVKEVVNVINFSHLMWPGLVGKFLPEVQEMCERLRITGESIMDEKLSSSEYIKGLIGRFRETEEAKARAEQAEAKIDRVSELMGRLPPGVMSQMPHEIRVGLRREGFNIPFAPGSAPSSAKQSPDVKPLDQRDLSSPTRPNPEHKAKGRGRARK